MSNDYGVVERQIANIGPSRHFAQHHARFSLVFNKHVVCLVLCLLFAVSPPAIIWSIRAVRVDSVERMLIAWARSHVTDESTVVVPPLGAHRDASASVVRILRVLGIEAPAFCTAPALVFGRDDLSSRRAVRDVGRRRDLSVQATATLRAAVRQSLTIDGRLTPAVALTDPIRMASAVGVGCSAEHQQSAVPLANSVVKSHSRIIRRSNWFSWVFAC